LYFYPTMLYKIKFEAAYLILIMLVGFVYYEGVIDIVGLQWMYLNVINLIATIYIITKKFLEKKNGGFVGIKNPLLLLYSLYAFFSVVSIFWAINTSVSLIAISKICTVLMTIWILCQLPLDKNWLINFSTIIFTICLLGEVVLSLTGYFKIIQVTDFEFSMAQTYLKGTAGNKNITAASIAFKIPFVYYLISHIKSNWKKVPLIVLLSFSFFNLILLSSRAVFLSITLCFLGLLISFFLDENKLKTTFRQLVIYLLPIIIAFSVFNYSNNDENLNIQSRASTINNEDISASTRLRYYSKGIKYFLSNPLTGSGIGNWQLISIQLDSDNIESYIVPYVAHNDFIEVFTEIGFFGGIFYLTFVLIISYWLYVIYFRKKQLINKTQIYYLSMPFIVYFVDANLNFPQYRPIMQISFVVYCFLIYNIQQIRK